MVPVKTNLLIPQGRLQLSFHEQIITSQFIWLIFFLLHAATSDLCVFTVTSAMKISRYASVASADGGHKLAR